MVQNANISALSSTVKLETLINCMISPVTNKLEVFLTKHISNSPPGIVGQYGHNG
jgi:hypothetical protein